MTAVMSRFLGLGFKLEELVAKATINPARALGIDAFKGSLEPCKDADVSIIEVINAKWDCADSEGKKRGMDRLIMPRACVKAGKLIESNPVAMPVIKD